MHLYRKGTLLYNSHKYKCVLRWDDHHIGLEMDTPTVGVDTWFMAGEMKKSSIAAAVCGDHLRLICMHWICHVWSHMSTRMSSCISRPVPCLLCDGRSYSNPCGGARSFNTAAKHPRGLVKHRENIIGRPLTVDTTRQFCVSVFRPHLDLSVFNSLKIYRLLKPDIALDKCWLERSSGKEHSLSSDVLFLQGPHKCMPYCTEIAQFKCAFHWAS